MNINKINTVLPVTLAIFVLVVLLLLPKLVHAQYPPQTGSGAIGVEGTVSAPPPTKAASISVPGNGQSFTKQPITVSGLCPTGLTVKLFKNNVFTGAAQCTSGSYSIIIDLFNGKNDLVARVYDSLDQQGPDSNTVTITFVDPSAQVASRVTLTSNYAKRGANPGEQLTWPIIISGGSGPYAVSVDWGDGSPTDLVSQQFPGQIDIKHKYDRPGVYNIIVKSTDKTGTTAFLQLVGISNGELSEQAAATQASDPSSQANATPQTKILWQPAAVTMPLLLGTFWLGRRYELTALRKRIMKGQRPFGK